MIEIINAIQSLCTENHPNSSVRIESGPDDITDLSVLTLTDNTDENEVIPSFTFKDVQDKQKIMQAEFDAQEYARNRKNEYPKLRDQLDMIFWDSKNNTNTHTEAIEAVKNKYPKPT